MTVPSCKIHNLDNATDVEYVRNVVTTHHENNDIARTHFGARVMGSFQNSFPYVIEGQDTRIITLDIPRFNNAMKAVVYALYYNDFGGTFNGSWMIYSPSLVNKNNLIQGQSDSHNEQLRAMLDSIDFTEQPTPQPEIFKYGRWMEAEDKVVYQFRFYDGFVVNALAVQQPSQSNAIVAAQQFLP